MVITFNAKAQIVYIDINSILNTSNVGKSLNSYLTNTKNEYLSKYKSIEENLIGREKSLLSKKNIIEKSEYDNQVSVLSKEIELYRIDKKNSQDNLNKIKIKYTKKILELINPIITNYVNKNSISLVIPKKNIIVGQKKLDITNEIIRLLNEKNEKLNFE